MPARNMMPRVASHLGGITLRASCDRARRPLHPR